MTKTTTHIETVMSNPDRFTQLDDDAWAFIHDLQDFYLTGKTSRSFRPEFIQSLSEASLQAAAGNKEIQGGHFSVADWIPLENTPNVIRYFFVTSKGDKAMKLLFTADIDIISQSLRKFELNETQQGDYLSLRNRASSDFKKTIYYLAKSNMSEVVAVNIANHTLEKLDY